MLEDTVGLAQALNNLGLVTWHQGDYPSERTMFEESLAATACDPDNETNR
jgi:hypothetical protein